MLKMLVAINQTCQMIAISSIVSVIGGLPLGCLIYWYRSKGQGQSVIALVLNSLVNIIRSIPFLILVILLIPLTRSIVGTAFGTGAAAVPLSIIGIALYSRFVEQSLLEINQNIIESVLAMGGNGYQILRHVVLVEARSSLVLGLTSVIISLFSYSTVMGIVGGGGIGDFAIIYGYQSNRVDLIIMAVIILIVMIQLIQFTGSFIADRLDKRKTKERLK